MQSRGGGEKKRNSTYARGAKKRGSLSWAAKEGEGEKVDKSPKRERGVLLLRHAKRHLDEI